MKPGDRVVDKDSGRLGTIRRISAPIVIVGFDDELGTDTLSHVDSLRQFGSEEPPEPFRQLVSPMTRQEAIELGAPPELIARFQFKDDPA